MSAFVALWAVIDIIVSPDKKSERHAKLSERFTRLAEKIALSPATYDAYSENVAARLRIERDEPPVKRLIDLQARNDEMRARESFGPDQEVPLNEWQQKFGYWFTFGMPRLEQWHRDQRTPST